MRSLRQRRPRSQRERQWRVYTASWGDVWLAGRMLTWSLSLRMLKYAVPLPKLARLMWVGSRAGRREPERERRIAALARAVCKIGRVARRENCLERSLVMYRFLSAVNAQPQLVVGVRKAADVVQGHAWVAVGAQPVGESAASLADFVPVVIFGEQGAAHFLRGSEREARPVQIPFM